MSAVRYKKTMTSTTTIIITTTTLSNKRNKRSNLMTQIERTFLAKHQQMCFGARKIRIRHLCRSLTRLHTSHLVLFVVMKNNKTTDFDARPNEILDVDKLFRFHVFDHNIVKFYKFVCYKWSDVWVVGVPLSLHTNTKP
jgi:hypothetical protein